MTTDTVFVGGIPKIYERYLVPLIFAPYADEIARRLASRKLGAVLEIAAGTGVVTRAMAATLPQSTRIVATDLNASMLEEAAAIGTGRAVEWQACDAMDLPFADATFDAVVCQFGAMFFPDKAHAFSEARRVLSPAGVLILAVWDRIEENDFPNVVTTALQSMFPHDPPRFLARTPHGYHDAGVITRDLARGGFEAAPHIETIAHRSRAASAEIAAVAFCQGTPLRNEIEARDASRLGEATALAAAALAREFGEFDPDGKIQAHVVTVSR